MRTPQRQAAKPAEIVQLPLTAGQVERIITALETSAAARQEADKAMAAAAAQVGQVAKGFIDTGEFLKKFGYWVALFFLAMAQVAFPVVKDALDTIPQLAQQAPQP